MNDLAAKANVLHILMSQNMAANVNEFFLKLNNYKNKIMNEISLEKVLASR